MAGLNPWTPPHNASPCGLTTPHHLILSSGNNIAGTIKSTSIRCCLAGVGSRAANLIPSGNTQSGRWVVEIWHNHTGRWETKVLGQEKSSCHITYAIHMAMILFLCHMYYTISGTTVCVGYGGYYRPLI